MIQGSLKDVWSLKEVSSIFQGSFKGVSRKVEGSSESPLIQESSKVYVKEVQRVFQGGFKYISRKIQGC